MGLHKLPYYAFIGYTGLVAVLSAWFAPTFDLAPGVGWCVLAGSYLVFFLSTIEQPTVRCTWAGWILGPSAIVVALAGVDIMNVVNWVFGLAAFGFGLYMGLTENVPSLARFDRHHLGHYLEMVFVPPRHRKPPKFRPNQPAIEPSQTSETAVVPAEHAA